MQRFSTRKKQKDLEQDCPLGKTLVVSAIISCKRKKYNVRHIADTLAKPLSTDASPETQPTASTEEGRNHEFGSLRFENHVLITTISNL